MGQGENSSFGGAGPETADGTDLVEIKIRSHESSREVLWGALVHPGKLSGGAHIEGVRAKGLCM